MDGSEFVVIVCAGVWGVTTDQNAVGILPASAGGEKRAAIATASGM